MNDWQALVSTTIAEYMQGVCDRVAENYRILRLLNPDIKPYVAPPDTRTPEQRLRDLQASCAHQFKRHYRGKCQCQKCAVIKPKAWVDGYEAGVDTGKEIGEDCY